MISAAYTWISDLQGLGKSTGNLILYLNFDFWEKIVPEAPSQKKNITFGAATLVLIFSKLLAAVIIGKSSFPNTHNDEQISRRPKGETRKAADTDIRLY